VSGEEVVSESGTALTRA